MFLFKEIYTTYVHKFNVVLTHTAQTDAIIWGGCL